MNLSQMIINNMKLGKTKTKGLSPFFYVLVCVYYSFYSFIMKELIALICIILLFVILYKVFKPYFLHYDNAVLFTGGVGSGKSLNTVKIAITLYKKNKRKVIVHNFKSSSITFCRNLFRAKNNKLSADLREKPLLYSNMPIKIGKSFCYMITKEHLTLQNRINLRSVVVLDEISKIANQFNWSLEEVQHHLNEFIQFFRHYSKGGYLVCNSQAESEVVKQIRTKLNSENWCFDFQKFLCFYRVRILHTRITENDVSVSTDFIEDTTKWTYGIILRKLYDTYYLSERYLNVPKNDDVRFKKFKHNKLLQFEEYESRCDDK